MKQVEELYAAAAHGNAEALDFLRCWSAYCNAIDDLVDGGERPAEETVQTFALAGILYACPFYTQHVRALQLVVMLVTNAYADSLIWEEDPREHRRQLADALRFAGNEMVLAVAFLTGGYRGMRAVSGPLREHSWEEHHIGKERV